MASSHTSALASAFAPGMAGGPCVLVVDDDPELLERVRPVANELSLEAVGVETLEEARRALRVRPVAAVLATAMLCDGPGTSLIGDIAVIDERLPLVVATPAGHRDVIVDAIRAGAVDLIARPLSATEIAAVLRRLLAPAGGPRPVAAPAAQLRVLCVDDDPLTLKLAGMALSNFGVQAKMVGSLTEARKVLEQEPPDVLILDLFLADESGLDLLAEVHARMPSLPVVVVTGSQSPEPLLAALRHGSSAVICKPFTREHLFRTVLRLHRERVERERNRELERALDSTRRKLVEATAGAGDPAPFGTHSKEDLAALATASLPSGLVVVDGQGTIRVVNPVAEELLAVSEAALAGQAIDRAPECAPFVDAVKDVLARGHRLLQQEATTGTDRTARTLGFSVAPLRSGPTLTGVIVSFQDITAKKRIEADRRHTERLASLGMVAESLAAEISGPVHNAALAAELVLRDPAVRTKSRLQLEKIRVALQRAGHFVNHVSRLLRSQVDAQVGPCDLHPILAESLRFAEKRLFMGALPVRSTFDASTALVLGDPVDFEYLFMMLLLSMSHSIPTGRTLAIRSLNQMGVLEIRFSGLAPERGASLADDLWNDGADAPPPRPPAAALGLQGLGHCRVLVNRLGGALRIEQQDGAVIGCTVRLPPATPEQCVGYVVGASAARSAVELPQDHRLIGLMASSDELAGLCETWIESTGMTVRRVPGSPEAAGPLEPAPDLMVIDMCGQGESWTQLLERLEQPTHPAAILLADSRTGPGPAALRDVSKYRIVQRPFTLESFVQALAMIDLENPTNPSARAAGRAS